MQPQDRLASKEQLAAVVGHLKYMPWSKAQDGDVIFCDPEASREDDFAEITAHFESLAGAGTLARKLARWLARKRAQFANELEPLVQRCDGILFPHLGG